MKITKFVHSCVLVEMPDPVNRTVLFDPGAMSESALDVAKLEYLDDVVITHSHADHVSMDLLTQIHEKFPEVRITAPRDVVDMLAEAGIPASSEPAEGMSYFDAPHEKVEPLFPRPEEIGVHYLDLFSHPGDSLSFNETMPVLALPVTAPWGATVDAVNLALSLKPRYVVPIHDWHWRDEAQQMMYASFEELFKQHDITFLKMETGVPQVIEV